MFWILVSPSAVRKFWIFGLILSFSLLVELPALSQQNSEKPLQNLDPVSNGQQLSPSPHAASRQDGADTKLKLVSNATGSGRGVHKPQADIAGVALSITGNWELYSGKQVRALKLGDAVPDGWSLRSLSKGANVQVVLTDGTTLTCPGCAGCQVPISVSKHQSLVDSWLSAAISMFVQKPDQWLVPESRTNVDIDPQDSVLKAGRTGIDLTPVCRGISDGTYYLNIRSADDSSSQRLGPEQISVAKASPVIVATPRLTPGLYIVNLSASQEDNSARQAWVLLSDARCYDRQLASYHKAVETSSALSPEVPANKVRELLRAYLAYLNKETKQGLTGHASR